MLVGRVVGGAAALACVALLSSCSLLPPGMTGDEGQQADAEMQHIANAVKDHDAAALKKLFSPRARERATDLDTGLAYFLSVFPSGFKTWSIEDGAPGGTQVNQDGYTDEVDAFYKVSANGKKYDLYIDDLTVNTNDPKNIGIYAIGAAPYNPEPFTKPTPAGTAFLTWTGQHDIADNNAVTGAPGVYIPQK